MVCPEMSIFLLNQQLCDSFGTVTPTAQQKRVQSRSRLTLLVNCANVVHALGQQNVHALQVLTGDLLPYESLPDHARQVKT